MIRPNANLEAEVPASAAPWEAPAPATQGACSAPCARRRTGLGGSHKLFSGTPETGGAGDVATSMVA